MNGSTLLNYARFRDDDEADYGRTKKTATSFNSNFRAN